MFVSGIDLCGTFWNWRALCSGSQLSGGYDDEGDGEEFENNNCNNYIEKKCVIILLYYTLYVSIFVYFKKSFEKSYAYAVRMDRLKKLYGSRE